MEVRTGIVVAVALGATLFPAVSSGARYPALSASGSTVVPCDRSMRGPGIPPDRAPTKRLGPFGIFEYTPDFRELRRYRNNLLGTKAPIGVTGTAEVTVTVPERARHRVALSYGRTGGRRAELRLQPCPHKARTVWPGGLDLRDRQPVTLLVAVGEAPPLPLRLGR